MSDKEKSTEANRIEKVRERAHAIWLDEGEVHGRDQEHWRQAEDEIDAQEEEAKARAVEALKAAPARASSKSAPSAASSKI